MVVGLPCAVRGACAHGNRTAPATDSAVPHDSAVSTGAGRARVCNTHHPCPSDTGIHASGRQVFTAHHPRRMRASARELTAVPAAYAPPGARGHRYRDNQSVCGIPAPAHAGTGFALRLAGVENNHRPRHMRASVELAHGDAAQPIRPPAPRTTTPGTTTTQSSRCPDTTISTQNRTDLEVEVNRSQCGL